jgi:protein-S-isoprenylcysteine O-methyltransferase Ste14
MVKGLSVAAFLSMVVGLLALLFPAMVLFTVSPVVIAFQVAALALMVWARMTFGLRSFHAVANPTEGGLVTSGPYHFIRHPIYTAVCLFAWPPVLAGLSVRSVLAGLLITTGAIVRMLCEEQLLVTRHPAYVEYMRTTKRMVPGVF